MIRKKNNLLFFICAAIVILFLVTVIAQINIRINAEISADRSELRAIIAEREIELLERQAEATHERQMKILESLKSSNDQDAPQQRQGEAVDLANKEKKDHEK